MRDGGQPVDAGVSEILSADCSFRKRIHHRTPVILLLQQHIQESERSASNLHLSLSEDLCSSLFTSIHDFSWITI